MLEDSIIRNFTIEEEVQIWCSKNKNMSFIDLSLYIIICFLRILLL